MEDLEVLREIGRGGFATVFLCRERSSDRLVALKSIPLERLHKPEQRRRVQAERFLLEHVQHPFLNRCFRSFQDDHFASFELEYIGEARPLYQCVWRYKTTSVFPEHVAKYFAVQIVLAVEAIHAMGFLHRDLKSGNVLVDKHGVARVIDYGFAKRVESEQESEQRTFSICGTHYVMAPEMYLGQQYGVEVDWWSVGVIVHEMLCGRPPWDYQPTEGKPLVSFLDQISNIAKGFSLGRAASPTLESATVSEDCKSFVKSLLQFNPKTRLGHVGGSIQVKSHPWFEDINWNSVANLEYPSPYDFINDFRVETSELQAMATVSSSSAESIDPEDDARFFGDF